MVKMVNSGYLYGIDTWQTFSTIMTLSTCTYQLGWFIVEKNISQLQKIICNFFFVFNYVCNRIIVETIVAKGGGFY